MELLASIYWDISPEIVRLGPLEVRWYGLLWAISFIVGYQLISYIFRTENRSQKDVESITIWMVVGTVIGARLGHCLFYEPEYYLSNPLEMLKVWEGGLASHGAALGNLISIYIFSKIKKIDFIWTLDRVAIAIAPGAFFVRLGNFMNSEILGTEANIPWAVVFAKHDLIPRHPAQMYEGLCYLAIFIFLFIKYRKLKGNFPPGLFFGLFLTMVFSARFIIEFFKMDQTDFEAGLLLNMGQILSIPFVIVGLIFFFRARASKTKIQ